MKEAFWALGIMIFGLFGIIMISLFGNITVTNQMNYTTMKNDVEASMYDALDKAYYRSGFCLCTNKSKTGEKLVFNDKSEYSLKDIVYVNGKESCPDTTNCEILKGEYRLNKKVFIESLLRRLAAVTTNNKDYKIIVKEIIEYPPKVSVRIDSKDAEFSPTEKESGGYTIVNQMDALVETWNTLPTPTPSPTPTPTAIPNPTDTFSCVVRYYRTVYSVCNGYSTNEACCEAKCRSAYNKYGNDKVGYRCYEDGSTQACEIEWTNKKHVGDCVDNGSDSGTPSQQPTTDPNGSSGQPGTNGSSEQPGTNGCFLAGTKIVSINGYTEIDKLKKGDYVLTYNEEKGTNEFKKITTVFVLNDLDEELYTIQTDNGEITLTSHHRLYTYRNDLYQYIAAEDMKVGDVVMYSNGEYHKIKTIQHKSIKKTVYNLEIEDNHNFYVGEKGILVHNAKLSPIEPNAEMEK